MKYYDNIKIRKKSRKTYIKFKKNYCENVDGRLGYICTSNCFLPGHLHVDHKDGCLENNSPENLQTLCGNCHYTKTHNNRDFIPNKFKMNLEPTQVESNRMQTNQEIKITLPSDIVNKIVQSYIISNISNGNINSANEIISQSITPTQSANRLKPYREKLLSFYKEKGKLDSNDVRSICNLNEHEYKLTQTEYSFVSNIKRNCKLK